MYLNKKSNLRWWAVVLLIMLLIFIFSSQPATQSNKLSKQVTAVIIEIIERAGLFDGGDMSAEEIASLFNRQARKYAHAGVYLLLAFFTMKALQLSGIRGFKAVFLSLAICVVYAVIDEIHQLYVPGRGAEFSDIVIDTSGACLGILIYLMFFLTRKKPLRYY